MFYSVQLCLRRWEAGRLSPGGNCVVPAHAAALHNDFGQLVRVVDGRLSAIWMVEALPAYSAEFWSG